MTELAIRVKDYKQEKIDCEGWLTEPEICYLFPPKEEVAGSNPAASTN